MVTFVAVLVQLIGVAAVVGGLWMWSEPVALVVGGLLLLLAGQAASRGPRGARAGEGRDA